MKSHRGLLVGVLGLALLTLATCAVVSAHAGIQPADPCIEAADPCVAAKGAHESSAPVQVQTIAAPHEGIELRPTDLAFAPRVPGQSCERVGGALFERAASRAPPA